MREYETSDPLKLPRRALALFEFAFAGFLLLLGVDGATTEVRGGGCANFGAGLMQAFSVPLLLLGLAVLLSAFRAWKGTRLWWVWQTALLALFVVGPMTLMIAASLVSAVLE
ncbi:MAG TPA: hypothetical protein VN282_12635 [Pyrinomonadaceae bacterium]|nr:hypothetical protein [Pyrinomonadaceae bacterium]